MITPLVQRRFAAGAAGAAAVAASAFLLAGALGAGPAVSAPAAVPGKTLHGKFVWFDLLTKDAAAAETFYAGLLGWTFEARKDRQLPYKVIRSKGEPIGGIADVSARAQDVPESTWLSYVSVGDVDAAAAAFKARSGKVLKEPLEVAGGKARAAVVTDPQGALVGLVHFAKGDRPDGIPTDEGRFLWMEYVAQDAEGAMAFYRDALGYEPKPIDAGVKLAYGALAAGGTNRAGLYQTPWKEVRSNWLPYVLVTDAAASAAKAKALGGRVVVEPRADVRNGSLAIIVDPTGAAIALQKWPFEAQAK